MLLRPGSHDVGKVLRPQLHHTLAGVVADIPCIHNLVGDGPNHAAKSSATLRPSSARLPVAVAAFPADADVARCFAAVPVVQRVKALVFRDALPDLVEHRKQELWRAVGVPYTPCVGLTTFMRLVCHPLEQRAEMAEVEGVGPRVVVVAEPAGQELRIHVVGRVEGQIGRQLVAVAQEPHDVFRKKGRGLRGVCGCGC